MAKITVYGIPNCDGTAKTLSWLKKNKTNFDFWDYKKSGITSGKLAAWCKEVGWEKLVNKRSTTWRSLSLRKQDQITSQEPAIELMMENNSIIKRPVIEIGKKLVVGFDESAIIKQIK